MNDEIKYTIRTLSYRGYAQVTINLTEDEAKEKFMEEFGEEPSHFNVLYTDGVFNPADIKPLTSITSCDCYE